MLGLHANPSMLLCVFCLSYDQGFLRFGLREHQEILWGRISFSKTFKIIPKRIVHYSIGSHSAQVVLLYLQKLQHKLFNFNFIKTALVHQ